MSLDRRRIDAILDAAVDALPPSADAALIERRRALRDAL
jgi:hypothetical protein